MKPEYFFGGYYLALSVILFIAMGADKLKAKKDAWRVPERTLFLLAVLSGAPGGLLGMFLFRHKTKKPLFYVVYIGSLLLHAAAWFYFLRGCLISRF